MAEAQQDVADESGVRWSEVSFEARRVLGRWRDWAGRVFVQQASRAGAR